MARFDGLGLECEVVGDKIEAKILGPPASLFSDQVERVVKAGNSFTAIARRNGLSKFIGILPEGVHLPVSIDKIESISAERGAFPVPANRFADAWLKSGAAVADHALRIALSTGRPAGLVCRRAAH